MAFKIVAILALAAIVSAGPLGQYKHVEYEHEAPAQYDFSYSVHDEHTGDIKSQQESRQGDAVHGSYSLIDSDGFKRTVEYTADDHHGFNAVVHREPTDFKVPTPVAAHVPHYAPVAKVVAPVHYQPAQYTKIVAPVHFQPAQQYHQAPVHYQPAAPVQYTKYVAPVVAKVVAPIHYSAPVAKVSVGYEANHVSFNGAGANYHY